MQTYGYGSNKFERWQGNGDGTGTNELKLKCRDGTYKTTDNAGSWGDWLGYKTCLAKQVICGIKTRVQRWQGGGRRDDDTALNGVELVCCEDKWEKEISGAEITLKNCRETTTEERRRPQTTHGQCSVGVFLAWINFGCTRRLYMKLKL